VKKVLFLFFRLRTSLRCDKLTCIFGLDNGLAVKAETGTTKFKLKGTAKALGCNQVPMVKKWTDTEKDTRGQFKHPLTVDGAKYQGLQTSFDHL
jgi:hypothetical protein